MNIEYYGEDGRIKSLGDNELAHFKYIKKIKAGSGWRYFYTPEEIKAYYGTTKQKIDSIPRLKKQGEKYYIADKKTQRKIEKSGVGNNFIYNTSKPRPYIDRTGVGTKSSGKPTDKQISKWKAEDYMEKAKNEKSERKKMQLEKKAMEELKKNQNRENVYSKYEAKNVINRKISDIKKKVKKTIKGKKHVEKKSGNTVKVSKKSTPNKVNSYYTKKNSNRSNPRSSNIRNNSIKKAR